MPHDQLLVGSLPTTIDCPNLGFVQPFPKSMASDHFCETCYQRKLLNKQPQDMHIYFLITYVQIHYVKLRDEYLDKVHLQ